MISQAGQTCSASAKAFDRCGRCRALTTAVAHERLLLCSASCKSQRWQVRRANEEGNGQPSVGGCSAWCVLPCVAMLTRGSDSALFAAFVGDQFGLGEEICGLVVSTKFKEDTFSVWNRNAEDKECNERIRQAHVAGAVQMMTRRLVCVCAERRFDACSL